MKTLLPKNVTKSIDILNTIKSNWEEGGFQTVWVTYRILLTIPVTVTSAERSFSKLKLIKTYLRTTMSQERLSGLAMISIENEYLDKLNYDDLIEDFASKNQGEVIFLESDSVNLWLVSCKYVVKELIVNTILYNKIVAIKGFWGWM